MTAWNVKETGAVTSTLYFVHLIVTGLEAKRQPYQLIKKVNINKDKELFQTRSKKLGWCLPVSPQLHIRRMTFTNIDWMWHQQQGHPIINYMYIQEDAHTLYVQLRKSSPKKKVRIWKLN